MTTGEPISRLADRKIEQLLSSLPGALLLVGPRSVGKTTTLRRFAAEVLSLDGADAVATAADPDAALMGRREPLLIDEWQAVPSVLGAVKRSVDALGGSRPGRFLLTGSVRDDLADTGASWPGTGRITRRRLFGLTVREALGRSLGPGLVERAVTGGDLSGDDDPPDLAGYIDLAITGGFPVPVLEIADAGTRRIWMEGYIDQLIARDLEQLAGFTTREPVRLRSLITAYAANSGGIVADTTLLDQVGVSRPTLKVWERLLEAVFLVDIVPAWRTRRAVRLAAAPKRFVVDPGLWAAILGVDRAGVLGDPGLLGRAIETFVAAQLRSECDWSDVGYRLHHVRSPDGHEIDLVAELADGRLVLIEVKATSAPTIRDAGHLRWFADKVAGDRVAAKLLLHTGRRTFPLGDDIQAVSLSALWGPGTVG